MAYQVDPAFYAGLPPELLRALTMVRGTAVPSVQPLPQDYGSRAPYAPMPTQVDPVFPAGPQVAPPPTGIANQHIRIPIRDEHGLFHVQDRYTILKDPPVTTARAQLTAAQKAAAAAVLGFSGVNPNMQTTGGPTPLSVQRNQAARARREGWVGALPGYLGQAAYHPPPKPKPTPVRTTAGYSAPANPGVRQVGAMYVPTGGYGPIKKTKPTFGDWLDQQMTPVFSRAPWA